MGGCEVRVGGVWLSSFADYGDLTYSDRWPGGCYEASWHLAHDAESLPPFLQRGQSVEVFAPSRAWKGVLAAPEKVDGGWNMTATGLAREGDRYHALTATGLTTSTPNTAIDQAIARGLPWIRTQSFSTTALVDGDTTNDLRTVTEVLDAWADEAGEKWGVDHNGYVYHHPKPTTADWLIPAGVIELGVSDAEYASHVYGRYIRTSDGTYQTAIASDADAAKAFGRAESTVDLTGRGPMTPTRAQTIVNGILAKGAARLRWTESFEPDRYELTTPGGVAADRRHVHAGQMARCLGALDPSTGLSQPISLVFGETTYRAADDRLILAPVDKRPSTLSDAIEKATGGSR